MVSDPRAALALPAMGASLALGRTLAALRARFGAALSALDSLGLGVFLVDGRGAVIDHNREAQRLLDMADGLSLDAARCLRLSDEEQTTELSTRVRVAHGLARGEEVAGEAVLAAARPSGAYDFLISVRALVDQAGELERGFDCAFVTVIDPERKNVLSVEGLAALGALSEAEKEVSKLLVEGARPAEVAMLRDVSLNTVKTQLKTINGKLRCAGQGDLIRVAAATRLPLRSKDHPNG